MDVIEHRAGPAADRAGVRRLRLTGIRLCLLLGVATFLIVFAPAGAPAAPPWSTPETVSSTSDGHSPSLGFDARGRALASWRWSRTEGRRSLSGWRTATRAPGAAEFDAERAAPDLAAAPVLFGTTRAIGLESHFLGRAPCGARYSLSARFGRSDGVFDAPKRISTFVTPVTPAPLDLAANDAGQALAAWVSYRGRQLPGDRGSTCKASVHIALRRPGKGFGKPVTLRTRRYVVRTVTVAIGEGGDMLVAWQRGGDVVEARYRRAGGRWGPVEMLGSLRKGSLRLRLLAAVAPNGRAYVSWLQPPSSKNPRRLVAAVRPANAARFGSTRNVDGPMRAPLFADPQLRLVPPGSGAMLVWTVWDGSHRGVRVAYTDRRGRFDPPRTMSPARTDFTVGDLAVGPNGAQVLALAEGFASIAPPGGSFGTFEPVGTTTGGSAATAVAIDPITRRPTMVWFEPAGPGQPGPVLRASTRDP